MDTRTFPRRAARRLHLSGQEEIAARSLLGAEHPLARGMALQRTVAIQLLVTAFAGALGLVGVLSHGRSARLELGAAGVVALLLGVRILVVRALVRERAVELIAEGSGTAHALTPIAHERRRLASRGERERLARSLERYLHDAERWMELMPLYRPPHEVRCIRFLAFEVRAVAELLRAESADVRGVAATTRFLVDGSASPLFRGDLELLRRELERLSRLLARAEPVESAPGLRAAA